VPEELQAPRRGSALDLEHHPGLEGLEPRMREEEGDADGRLVAGGEPLVGEEADGLQPETGRLQLAVELPDPRLRLRPADPHPQVADAQVEEVVVGELLPRDLARWTRQGGRLLRSETARMLTRAADPTSAEERRPQRVRCAHGRRADRAAAHVRGRG